MADFNTDNQRIDNGVAALQTSLDSQAGTISSQAATLNSHAATIGSQGATLNSHATTINSQAGTINSHIAAAELHLTQEQRDRIAASGSSGTNFSMITYTGNGAGTRRVALGFRPGFGFLFAVGIPGFDNNSHNSSISAYSAFFSQEGCGEGVTLENQDIVLRHATHSGPDGNRTALNENGIRYVIVAAR
jgi:hypothetical protein